MNTCDETQLEPRLNSIHDKIVMPCVSLKNTMKTEKESEHSAIEFPCDFPIKVMGRADADFDLLAVNIVRKYVPDVLEGAVKSRLSRNQNYIAVTITVEAQSQEQLDNIYQELTAHERVIMAL